MRNFKHSRSAISRMCHAVKNETGQALIETYLALPILLLILVGAVEIARVGYASIEVMNAASAGVKFAAESPANETDTAGIQLAAGNDAANISLDPVGVTSACVCSDSTGSACSPTGGCTGSSPETILTVTTQTHFNPGFHLPGFPTTFVLSGSAVQKVLQ
jgi:Flp pilus assembly protein TadG